MANRNGMILYSNSPLMIGQDVYRSEFQARLPSALKDSLPTFASKSIEGESSLQDFSLRNEPITIAYQPIMLESNLVRCM